MEEFPQRQLNSPVQEVVMPHVAMTPKAEKMKGRLITAKKRLTCQKRFMGLCAVLALLQGLCGLSMLFRHHKDWKKHAVDKSPPKDDKQVQPPKTMQRQQQPVSQKDSQTSLKYTQFVFPKERKLREGKEGGRKCHKGKHQHHKEDEAKGRHQHHHHKEDEAKTLNATQTKADDKNKDDSKNNDHRCPFARLARIMPFVNLIGFFFQMAIQRLAHKALNESGRPKKDARKLHRQNMILHVPKLLFFIAGMCWYSWYLQHGYNSKPFTARTGLFMGLQTVLSLCQFHFVFSTTHRYKKLIRKMFKKIGKPVTKKIMDDINGKSEETTSNHSESTRLVSNGVLVDRTNNLNTPLISASHTQVNPVPQPSAGAQRHNLQPAFPNQQMPNQQMPTQQMMMGQPQMFPNGQVSPNYQPMGMPQQQPINVLQPNVQNV